ncbi:hypothetical protein GCM10027343_16740 [Noviherbaspirillum agri]
MDKNMAIFVLTGRGIETMLAEGGSQAWTIDASRARDCKYVVCIQNHKQDFFNPRQLSAPHHTAFLIGKLAGIGAPDDGEDQKGNRKKLLFSEYAEINIPDAWPGNRNPVFYGALEDLDINVDALHFRPMPEIEPTTSNSGKVQALTIQEAKAGLALTFGVDPANIEILIRG